MEKRGRFGAQENISSLPFISPVFTLCFRVSLATKFCMVIFHHVSGSVSLFSLFTEGDEVGTGITDDNEDENSANQIAGKIPNFCVLLHGSLKVEGMVAIVQLG